MQKSSERMIDMNLDQLRYLVDIEQTGSITESAERMFITQQAVSKSVQKLEHELGTTILLREKYGVVFTEQGKEVLNFAKDVLAQEAVLRHFLNSSEEKGANHWRIIKIASASSIANLFLPKVISKSYFKKKALKANITTIDNLSSLLQQLDDKNIDIGLISLNENNLMDEYYIYEDSLSMEVLYRDELISVMDRKYCEEENLDITMLDYSIHPMTIYNIIPVKDMKQFENYSAYDLVCSMDADFHRSMMEHAGAITHMSHLAYKCFFSQKRYREIPMGTFNFPVLHVAICRKDADTVVRDLITMLRLEMHMK